MKSKWLVIAFLIMVGCNDSSQDEVEQKRIIRQRFDSMDREMDSFNKKIQRGVDSAIHDIDSLLKELDSKKTKK